MHPTFCGMSRLFFVLFGVILWLLSVFCGMYRLFLRFEVIAGRGSSSIFRYVSSVSSFFVVSCFRRCSVCEECLVCFAFFWPWMFFAVRRFLWYVSSILSSFALVDAIVLSESARCLVCFSLLFVAVSAFCDPSRVFFVFLRRRLHRASFLRDVSSIFSVFPFFSRLRRRVVLGLFS